MPRTGTKIKEAASGTDVTLTTTTETVVGTLTGVSTGDPAERVGLHGWAQVTTGTGTTALTIRIRRGSTITGTLVGEANAQQVQAAAGSTEEVSIDVQDTPGEVASQTYVVTVQQTGATGNGTALQSLVRAILGEQ